MPQVQSDEVYLHAQQIFANFPDRTVHYQNGDIHVSKSKTGDDILLFQQGEDNHRVRLYLTKPENDWRQNVTYRWALSNAWMSIPGTEYENGSQTDWLFWNIENNVDSVVKVWNPRALFSCESITLHVREMSRTPWKESKASVPTTKIVLQGNVLLGANYSEEQGGPHQLPMGRYRPCQSSVCHIVDGVVASESVVGIDVPSILSEGVTVYVVITAVAVLILWVLFACYRCYRRRMMTQQYNPIAQNNVLTLEEEEYRNEEEFGNDVDGNSD